MLLRTLFGPRNSLILLYDLTSGEALARMEEETREIGEYYEWAPLPQIAKGSLGQAAIAFFHPRKRVVREAVPKLSGAGTPFTLFLRSDCIGLNRLPIEDELDLRGIAEPERGKYIAEVWQHPEERPRLGALPLETADPLNYFATWGEILAATPSLRSVGLHLFFDPDDAERLRAEKKFLEMQMAQAIDLMLVPRAKNPWETNLRAAGFSAVLTLEEGAVDKKTNAFQLTRFVPEENG